MNNQKFTAMPEKIIYTLDDPRAFANRLDRGYIDIMVAAQFAREKGLISDKFESIFNTLVTECCIRLKQHMEPAAAEKRREMAQKKLK